jgi:hypothetical protein
MKSSIQHPITDGFSVHTSQSCGKHWLFNGIADTTRLIAQKIIIITVPILEAKPSAACMLNTKVYFFRRK